jgi:hypothetical protein
LRWFCDKIESRISQPIGVHIGYTLNNIGI